jgi:hypothetical protein
MGTDKAIFVGVLPEVRKYVELCRDEKYVELIRGEKYVEFSPVDKYVELGHDK